MKYLITGGNGQLARALFEAMKTSNQAILLPKEELDVTDEQTVEKVFKKFSPEYVFHTAAYTAVDSCEKEQVTAFQINSLGAFNIAKACKSIGAVMIYISSDYVFDGKSNLPYIETDSPNPLSIYGLSKWLGEELVGKTLSESYIVRTSWLYGHGGLNFVHTMLKFAVSNKEVKVVSDQVGSPTYVNDLARILIQLIEKKYGTYHVSNKGQCSWYQFAQAIFEYAGSDSSLVQPITTGEYGASAPRPAYSLLSVNKLISSDLTEPRHWKEALKDYLAKEGLYD
jgi:dTDP-4-dehydrorhamnose reductase